MFIDAYNGKVLGIMLTGLGRDGAREFTRLKSIGGWTIAQDPLSCTVFGMPKALIDAGGACEIIPLKSIASRISGIIGGAVGLSAGSDNSSRPKVLKLIIEPMNWFKFCAPTSTTPEFLLGRMSQRLR